MRPLFSFRWRSSGLTAGRREVDRYWWLVRLAPVREEEEDSRLGREGELGRPRGRCLVGRWGGGGGRLKKKKKGMGRGWAERPDELKVKEKFLSE
jgi:hypothetical protein